MIISEPPSTEYLISLKEHFRHEDQDDKPMVLIPYGMMALSGFIVGLTVGLFIASYY